MDTSLGKGEYGALTDDVPACSLRPPQDLPQGVLLRLSRHPLQGGPRSLPPGPQEQGTPSQVGALPDLQGHDPRHD